MFKIMALLTYFVIIFIPAEAAVPGTFFWKPRLGLSMAIPKKEQPRTILKPTLNNVRSGKVVLIQGYQAGITVLSLASGIEMASVYDHHNPTSAYYYTNVYRWALRHLNLFPDWLGGTAGHYVESQKLWRRRFYYMDRFVPQWMRKILWFVDKKEWEKEEAEFKIYSKYVEPSFGKYYRYPSKYFNNYASNLVYETVENLDSGSI